MIKNPAQPHPLDSISLVGKQHEEDESSTAAVGRIIYRSLTGSEPEPQEARKGPTAYPIIQHLNRWEAHLAYGSALAAITKTLQWLL